MSEDLSELDALFDEISSQQLGTSSVQAQNKPEPAKETTAVSTEDVSDKPMFERLGGIVRLLHDSLRELGYDRSLSDVASQIGDAQGRLEYVATLTEQAANKVLNTIDESMPQQDALAHNAKDIEARWDKLYAGALSVEDFKILAADSRQFAADTARTADAERARLLDIMMAQDFQDITGRLC
jgi:chemotaxis protein CheZ